MQRTLFFLAYLFIWASAAAQQYPFVNYSPKDGLVNGRVRKAYQDSKGRMYFLTYGGLSVYDGTKFKNYTVQDGLAADLVNDVLEAGNDSLWIACNTGALNYLRQGKIREFKTADGFCPTINTLLKTQDGAVYAAADEGLFVFQQNKFISLPLLDSRGRDAGKFLAHLFQWNSYLIIMSDQVLNQSAPTNLYIYDIAARRIIAEEKKMVHTICAAGNNTIYVADKHGVAQLDTAALLNHTINYLPLPDKYKKIIPGANYLYFDKQDNFWVFYDSKKIVRVDASGSIKEFSIDNGLSSDNFTGIFQDREGIIWITMNDVGIDKLVTGDIELYDQFKGVPVNSLYANGLTDSVYMYSDAGKKIITLHNNSATETSYTGERIFPNVFVAEAGKIYLSDGRSLFLLYQNKPLQPLSKKLLYEKTVEGGFGNFFIDPYKNVVLCSNSFLIAVVADTFIFRYPVTDYIDQLAFDKKNRLWAATRAGELYILKINPDNRENYLELLNKFRYDTIYSGLTARSLTADHFNNLWMGTRHNGLYCFQFDEKLALKSFQQYTLKEGLSDNFVTHLTCDNDNNIWASTASGVDKIHFANDSAYIENITRSSHIYKYIQKTFVTKAGVAWSHAADGNIIRIGKRNVLSSLQPALFITGIKIGDSVINIFSHPTSYNYRQNTFTVSVAAPSFYDEKQVKYSYWLQGGGNHHWSEPSNNSTFNFISLNPGEYNLKIKALFPGGRYPDQAIEYAFIIHPPWWQTWWFRAGIGISGIALLVGGIRFYYRRKLEKQKIILEKQQAVEKERTRIATDIHDDLGSGLSRIRYLGETIRYKSMQQENILPDIEKISLFSDEMVDKMNEIVWALNEKNDTLEAMISYIRSFAAEYLSANNLQCHVRLPDEIPHYIIKGETRRNIFLTVKESLHNIVKHAEATEALLTITVKGLMIIHIKDNGKGIDWEKIRPFSNGITNIKKRMKETGGTAEFNNERGTTVVLRIPLL